MAAADPAGLAQQVRQFVLRDFQPRFDQPRPGLGSDPLWLKMREVGSDLWLDTGSLDEAGGVWTREFSALTTNNTLLNREVQTGYYDQTIVEAARMLGPHQLDRRRLMLEIAFILNARHALRLVDRFDAYVSVEEHTDLAGDVDGAVDYGLRYQEICPRRFFVKVPFTPAGLIATRRLVERGVKVNHTLGFSARQNYLIARLARPAFVNVFLGRLNSFVADNGLGSGEWVGEKATLASQQAIRTLRQEQQLNTRQIAASLRDGRQVASLAGVDVLTMPPKVAREFLELKLPVEQIQDQTSSEYQPATDRAQSVGLATLWDIDQSMADCVNELERRDFARMRPDELTAAMVDCGCGDVLVRWSDEEVNTSRAEGKIPRLATWQEKLASGDIGLDSLMNLAGLNSFRADQEAMDQRVAKVLADKAGMPAE